jgi:hypothetical protein
MDSNSTPSEARFPSLNVQRGAARASRPVRPHAPVQLPRPAADLVERMLSARCGSRR